MSASTNSSRTFAPSGARRSCRSSRPAIRTWSSPPPCCGELVARGADLCELGIPYSDPIADGPVIQASYTRALAQQDQAGADSRHARAASRRKLAAPIVTMVSYAIVYRHGLAQYVADAQAAGVAGAIVPDLLGRRSRRAGRDLPRGRFQPDPTRHAHHAARAGPANRRELDAAFCTTSR